MRSLFWMLGAYALYRIVQENSQPEERQLALPLPPTAQKRKSRAGAHLRAKASV